MIGWKVLGTGGRCVHGGVGRWPLPSLDQPGEWTKILSGKIQGGVRGYHLVDNLHDLLEYLDGDFGLYQAELDDDGLVDGRLCYAGRRGRLLKKLDGWGPEHAWECLRRLMTGLSRTTILDPHEEPVINAYLLKLDDTITRNGRRVGLPLKGREGTDQQADLINDLAAESNGPDDQPFCRSYQRKLFGAALNCLVNGTSDGSVRRYALMTLDRYTEDDARSSPIYKEFVATLALVTGKDSHEATTSTNVA